MRLSALPRFIPPSVYDETRETVRQKYSKIPGVIDVIEYGTIPQPGISDMDFIVVIEPNAKVTLPPLKTYFEDQQYAMSHSHFVVSKNTIGLLRYFDPFIVRFDPILGNIKLSLESPELVKLTEEEHISFSLDYPLTSWILPSLPAIAKTLVTGELECREFLESVKLLPYVYREFNYAKLTKDASEPFTSEFRGLGNEWFTFAEDVRLKKTEDVFGKFRSSTRKILEICDLGLSERSSKREIPKELAKSGSVFQKKIFKKYPNSICVCIGNDVFVYQKERADIELTYQHFKSLVTNQAYERSVAVLPLHLSATQNRLLFEEGHVPDKFRCCFFTDLSEIPVYTHPALERRTRIINQTLDETSNVEGGKMLGKTYGLRFSPKQNEFDWNLRGRIGGIYDRSIEKLIRTPLGKPLRNINGTAAL